MKKHLVLLSVSFSLALPICAEVRVWKNQKGQAISAELTGLQGDKVMLKMANGRVVPYALDQLSPEDQAYVRNMPAAGSSGDAQKGMTKGNVKLESATQLAFGPAGVLFIGDSRAAAVVALATGDTKPGKTREVKVEGIDQKLAALLGTSVDQVVIQDVAVNPLSKNIYLAVSRGKGPDAASVVARVDEKGRDPARLAGWGDAFAGGAF